MGPERESAHWRNWLLALVTTVVVLGAAEWGFRRAATVDPTIPALFRIPHPVLGWALEPDVSYRNPFPDGDVLVTVNSAGWRDLERSFEGTAGTGRIAVLGDSFIEAYSVDLEQAFHRQLETVLLTSGHRFEVLGFGVAGYSTLQEYLAFREAAVRYSPHLVLLGFCLINDVRDNSRELTDKLGDVVVQHGARPFLERAGDSWRITPTGVTATEAPVPSVLRHLYARSWLLRRIPRAVRARALRRRSQEHPEEFHLSVNGVNYCEPTPEYERAWEVTAEILRRLREEVEGAGGELAVFTVPTRRESNERLIAGADRAADGRLCLREAPANRRLAAILDQLGVPLIDLLPAFRERLAEGEVLYRPSDRHWNARGHALAADLVLAELDRHALLPAAGGQSSSP